MAHTPRVVPALGRRYESATASPGTAGAGSVVLGLALLGWITGLLVLDTSGTQEQQAALGVATFLLLAIVLAREPGVVRAQTLIVVVVATGAEIGGSLLLEAYRYRFHNVPMYVPPAHGLVYLAALALSRTTAVRHNARVAMLAVAVAGTAWAIWGLAQPNRPDVLGAFWCGCLLVFLACSPSRLLFVGAFVVVGYLELLGTTLGVWTWQPHDVTGFVAIGNPPSGVAGGYCWFDLVAVTLAPVLIRWRRRIRPSGTPGSRQVVQGEVRMPISVVTN